MFGKKKKLDYRDKLDRIERSIWELENKQIVYLDKLKAVIVKQAELKERGKCEKERNMQRHYAGLYNNCEKEKEQIAHAINEISKEILNAARLSQLVDTQALTIELAKTESLSLSEINAMSESISKTRVKREAEESLKTEAIDRALRFNENEQDEDVDRILGLWEEERSAEDELKAFEGEKAAAKNADEEIMKKWDEERREEELSQNSAGDSFSDEEYLELSKKDRVEE